MEKVNHLLEMTHHLIQTIDHIKEMMYHLVKIIDPFETNNRSSNPKEGY